MGNELDILVDAAEGLGYSHRAMFGGEGFFAPNGQMFAAELKGEIALRIPEPEEYAALLARGAKPFNPLGRMPRGMKHWLVVPDDFLDEPHQLRDWVRRSHALSTVEPTQAKRAVAKKDAKKAAKVPKRPPRASSAAAGRRSRSRTRSQEGS